MQALADSVTCVDRAMATLLPACGFSAADVGVPEAAQLTGGRAGEYICDLPGAIDVGIIADTAAERFATAVATLVGCSRRVVRRVEALHAFPDRECAIQSQALAEMASAVGKVSFCAAHAGCRFLDVFCMATMCFVPASSARTARALAAREAQWVQGYALAVKGELSKCGCDSFGGHRQAIAAVIALAQDQAVLACSAAANQTNAAGTWKAAFIPAAKQLFKDEVLASRSQCLGTDDAPATAATATATPTPTAPSVGTTATDASVSTTPTPTPTPTPTVTSSAATVTATASSSSGPGSVSVSTSTTPGASASGTATSVVGAESVTVSSSSEDGESSTVTRSLSGRRLSRSRVRR